MSQQFNVAVLGASGAVGQAMIEILEERGFPVATLYPLASSRSAGDTVRFGGKNIEIKDVEEFDWSQVRSRSSPPAPRSRPSGHPSRPSRAASSSTTPPASVMTKTFPW